MPQLVRGSSTVFALLALFVVGSTLSIFMSLMLPSQTNAITDEQKAFCKANFPKGTSILNDKKTGIKEEWVANDCEGDGYCIREGIGASLSSGGCKEASIEATPALKDGVKKGYGDLAAKELCGGDAQCEATMRGYVATCIDEYIDNPPANAPEFPTINTDTLVNCMARDGKLDASQRLKLMKLFKENTGEIATAANKAEEAAKKQACEDDGGTWIEESGECGTKVTCTSSIQGVGYIVCPVMNFMAETNDWAYGFLASKFLSVDVGMVDGVKDSWAKFRDLANIAFVVALLIVIYSQITSVGISNYGIKKMLPKIVIAAVLVNVSYDICRIAVDLSNILGYGIAQFFAGNFGFLEVDTDNTSALSSVGKNFTIAGAVGLAFVGTIGVAIAVGVPVILSAALALALIVLILLLREALIILLIAIAPLAFVAYLLPNTEQWYKKWLKLFSTLLLLFPIIGLVFGASKLAATIMLDVGAKQSATGEAGGITQMLAIGVLTVPFFIVPGLLKGSLNAIGGLGGKLSGMADRAGKRVGKNLSEKSLAGAYKKSWDRNQQIKRAQILGGVYKGKGPLARAASRVNSAINSSRISGSMGTRTAQQAAQMANKLEIENVEAAKAQIEQANLSNEALRTLANGGKVAGINGSDAAARAAAIGTAADRGDYKTVQEGWDATKDLKGKTGEESRRAVAGALSRSSGKPAFIGQGALQEMREGEKKDATGKKIPVKSYDEAALAGITAGAYSPEAIAKASKDELEEVARIAKGNAAAEAAVTRAATDADAHPDISKTIGKNRNKIDKFKGGDFSPK